MGALIHFGMSLFFGLMANQAGADVSQGSLEGGVLEGGGARGRRRALAVGGP